MSRRTRITGAVAGAVVLSLSGLGSATFASNQTAASGEPRTAVHRIARFGPTDATFAESAVTTPGGTTYTSTTIWGDLNTGRLYRVSASGHKHRFGPDMDLGASGMLLGVTLDTRQRLYVAEFEFDGASPSAIYRVSDKRVTQVASLPAGAWPNGVAFHAGQLYVSDPAQGAIWRFKPGRSLRTLTTPWLSSPRLTPTTPEGIGVNGIAFSGTELFAVNADRGTLLRVHLGPKGSPGPVQLVVKRARLLTADGLTVGRHGRLWVAVNGTSDGTAPLKGQYVLALSRGGTVLASWKDKTWMNYPTEVTIRDGAVAVLNGAFYGGRATLVRLGG
jgi:sugar lactone lactonase YvrE